MGLQCSWRQALDQAADAAYRLYRPGVYQGALPEDLETAATWHKDVRDEHCPNALPTELYTLQCPSFARSQACLAPGLGWRKTLADAAEIRQSYVLYLGGSGHNRYPHSGAGRSIMPSVKVYGGWPNLIDFIGAGKGAREFAKGVRGWREAHHHLLQPLGDGTYQFGAEIKGHDRIATCREEGR